MGVVGTWTGNVVERVSGGVSSIGRVERDVLLSGSLGDVVAVVK